MIGLNPEEIKAVRALFPYFSKNPVVFDIGSNKGNWAEILIHNVDTMYLFEPNDRLLTYTMVKFDYLDNVMYYNKAFSNEVYEVDFQYFTDNHNGLSNIISNERWDYLKPKKRKLKTSVLDHLKLSHEVDFIKIDVEGAEFLVLQGAEKMLKKKRVKFIQIEKSEHYDFTPVPEFVRQYDYDVFHFDGGFVKWTDQEAENLYIMDAEFTQDWNKEFIKNTQGLKKSVAFALEIGAFEGLTSRYICDNLLLDKDARMICVDPLTDEYLPDHPDNGLFVGQYGRFIRNTRNYPIELIRKRSHAAWKEMQDYRFDFIYIDGDHTEQQVYEDGINCFHLCRVGGHILFDDYEWREETKRGIDRFIADRQPFLEVVIRGYQVMIKKTQNYE